MPPDPDNLEFIFPRPPAPAERPPAEEPPPIATLHDVVTDPPSALDTRGRSSRRVDGPPPNDGTATTSPTDRNAERAPEATPAAVDELGATAAQRSTTPDAAVPGDASATLEPDARLDDATWLDRDLELDDSSMLGEDRARTDDRALGPFEVDLDDGSLAGDDGSHDASDLAFADESAAFAPSLDATPATTDTTWIAARAQRGTARVPYTEETMGGRPTAGFGAIARTLLVLVCAHAALAVLIRVDPGVGHDLLARIPLVGARLGDEPALGGEILLRNIQGGYQRLKNAHVIFVISGEAVNNSLATVERIQVEGALYGASGVVDRKVISTGNETTLRLSELSEPEIALLQRFEPRATLAPGASVSFSIVFLEPPPKLREFSSRVVTARPTGRGSSPPASHPQDPVSVG